MRNVSLLQMLTKCLAKVEYYIIVLKHKTYIKKKRKIYAEGEKNILL